MRIIDLNGFHLSERLGSYTGNSCLKESIIMDGCDWMIKYPQSTKGLRGNVPSYTSSPLSEYLGSHIYQILGLDVHKTELGYRNNKIVVACRDFCQNGWTLREFRALKNTYNHTLAEQLEQSVHSTDASHRVPLETVLLHFKYNPLLADTAIQQRFWDMFVIDIFINNNDRNDGNWGMLYRGSEHTLAPVYDNGSAFETRSTLQTLENVLQSEGSLVSKALGGITAFSYGDKLLNAKDIQKIQTPGLAASLHKIVPLIDKKFQLIMDLVNEMPETYEGLEVCHRIRKEYYIASMRIRFEQLLIPALCSIAEHTNCFSES